MSYSPLLGDSEGYYIIAVVGNTGSGKTTLAAELSRLLNIPHLPLDTILWKPGWVMISDDEFRARVRAFMNENPNGWIIDGNSQSHIGTMATDAATDVSWLNPPLVLNIWRLLLRTIPRMFTRHESCAPGCEETFGQTFFSKDSILLECLQKHSKRRRGYGPIWEQKCAEQGRGKWRRFGGWGWDMSQWLRWLKVSIKFV